MRGGTHLGPCPAYIVYHHAVGDVSDAGMAAIKLYAWEEPYVERITELRNAEVKLIRRGTSVLTLASHPPATHHGAVP